MKTVNIQPDWVTLNCPCGSIIYVDTKNKVTYHQVPSCERYEWFCRGAEFQGAVELVTQQQIETGLKKEVEAVKPPANKAISEELGTTCKEPSPRGNPLKAALKNASAITVEQLKSANMKTVWITLNCPCGSIIYVDVKNKVTYHQMTSCEHYERFCKGAEFQKELKKQVET